MVLLLLSSERQIFQYENLSKLIWVVARNGYPYLQHCFSVFTVFFFRIVLFVSFSGRTTVSYVNYDAVVQFCEDYSRDHMYLEGQILSMLMY